MLGDPGWRGRLPQYTKEDVFLESNYSFFLTGVPCNQPLHADKTPKLQSSNYVCVRTTYVQCHPIKWLNVRLRALEQNRSLCGERHATVSQLPLNFLLFALQSSLNDFLYSPGCLFMTYSMGDKCLLWHGSILFLLL